ncbi:hypothetical protein [Sphingobacterium paucimobilis]|uniref:Uncharacterized protein n=1 Tax=Sphingobacterium paucimobilis HER1398 TaxID=1346330 RepID=U2J3W4_9SPHI|nr:hypothetical protein [Sphingobacterium paucimobilis]ERJ57338.1 hypothetical protein M472_01025 [Sphingobacterium paucimobilis HER1398]
MARLEGLIKMKGQIGDLTFFKTKDGSYQVRMKGGVSGERIATDPRFQRTRENGAEFGRAAAASKKMRDQLRELFEQNVDSRISQRLSSRMSAVIKADSVNERGERRVLAENLPMLTGLECNTTASLTTVFYGKLQYAYDRTGGEATLTTGAFSPRSKIARLEGATHARFSLAVLEYSADSEDVPVVVESSPYIDVLSMGPEQVDLTAALTADPAKAVIVLVGIGYFQEVNGAYYPLANGLYNALTFAAVDRP